MKGWHGPARYDWDGVHVGYSATLTLTMPTGDTPTEVVARIYRPGADGTTAVKTSTAGDITCTITSGQVVVTITSTTTTALGVGRYVCTIEADGAPWISGECNVLRANAGQGRNVSASATLTVGTANTVEVTIAPGRGLADLIAADAALDVRLDAIEADYSTSTEVATAVSAEATIRAAADTALAGRLDTLEADPITATDAVSAITTAVSAEAMVRSTADNALDARLDAIEGLGSLATDAEVMSAISTHAGAADPHGDRAYAAALVDDLSGVSNASTARTNLGLVIGTNVQAWSSVLDSTTAAFTTAQQTKLSGIESGATADQTAAEILAALLTVDGAGSGLDADLLDGQSSAAFAAASHNHAASAITSGTIDVSRLPAATETAIGAVELATVAEAVTGTDTTRAVTAAGVASSVAAHSAAADPHGDRAYAAGLVDDLSGVTNAPAARAALGLGTAATTASTAYDPAGSAAAAQAAALAAIPGEVSDYVDGLTISDPDVLTHAANLNAHGVTRGLLEFTAATPPHISGNLFSHDQQRGVSGFTNITGTQCTMTSAAGAGADGGGALRLTLAPGFSGSAIPYSSMITGVVGGSSLTLSFRAQQISGSAGAKTVDAIIEWYDAGGSGVGTANMTDVVIGALGAGPVTCSIPVGSVPATATQCRVYPYVTPAFGWAAGDVVDFSVFSIRTSPTIPDSSGVDGFVAIGSSCLRVDGESLVVTCSGGYGNAYKTLDGSGFARVDVEAIASLNSELWLFAYRTGGGTLYDWLAISDNVWRALRLAGDITACSVYWPTSTNGATFRLRSMRIERAAYT